MSSHEKPINRQWRLTRRGFLTGVGSAAAAASVSGCLLSNVNTKKTTTITQPTEMNRITLHVNGRDHPVLVESRWTLLYVLREIIGLTGSKEGCGRGECGACTVLIDGIARYACLTLAMEAEGHVITTVEGLMEGESLGTVQSAFVEADAFQCGYCTPGQIISVEGLLRSNPSPSIEEIQTAVSGNLCRCGAYTNIFKAAEKAAKAKKS